MEQFNNVLFFVKLIMASAVLFCLILVVIKPMISSFSSPSAKRETSTRDELTIPDEISIEIPTSTEHTKFDRKKILDKALKDPLRTSTIVKNWLTEKK